MARWVAGLAAAVVALGVCPADASVTIVPNSPVADVTATLALLDTPNDSSGKAAFPGLPSPSPLETVFWAAAIPWVGLGPAGLWLFDECWDSERPCHATGRLLGRLPAAGDTCLVEMCSSLGVQLLGPAAERDASCWLSHPDRRKPLPEPASLAIWSWLGLTFARSKWWHRRRRSPIAWLAGDEELVQRPVHVSRPKARKPWPTEVELAIKRLIDRKGVF